MKRAAGVPVPQTRSVRRAVVLEPNAASVAVVHNASTATCASRTAAAAVHDPPQRLQGRSRPYERVRRVGAGVAGVVYEYKDTSNGKSVAIKFPMPAAASAERSAFGLSKRINPRCNYGHHLSPAYEIVHVAGVGAQVWGWAGEQTFAAVLGSRSFWRDAHPHYERASLGLMAQVLAALDTLHRAGHIHGDLHPENIMIHQAHQGGRSILNLIDFGFCLRVGRGGWARDPRFAGAANLASGPAVGYPQHPPELWCRRVQLHSSDTAAPWRECRVHGSHDVWSAGMLLYMLVQVRQAMRGAKVTKATELVQRMASAIDAAGGACASARREMRQVLLDCCPEETSRKLLVKML
eukprot:g5231.t1